MTKMIVEVLFIKEILIEIQLISLIKIPSDNQMKKNKDYALKNIKNYCKEIKSLLIKKIKKIQNSSKD
jgi:hypothetical protein